MRRPRSTRKMRDFRLPERAPREKDQLQGRNLQTKLQQIDQSIAPSVCCVCCAPGRWHRPTGQRRGALVTPRPTQTEAHAKEQKRKEESRSLGLPPFVPGRSRTDPHRGVSAPRWVGVRDENRIRTKAARAKTGGRRPARRCPRRPAAVPTAGQRGRRAAAVASGPCRPGRRGLG